MATLLFECFSEEMPARMQKAAREQLQQLLVKALQAGNIAHGAVATFASPRHLAIRVEGLPAMQPDVTIEKKGPKLGAPQPAIDGFLKSTGLTLDQCEQRVIGKDTVYFASTTVKGRPMAEWLKDALDQLMRDFTWPKSMRWGSHNVQWVRPLHRIVALLGSTVIPVRFGHITAGNVTEGHRFLAPAPFTLGHADDYVGALEKAHVMVDAERRRAAIADAANEAARASGLSIVEDAGLLEEVTGLVEWPFCHVGTFDASFMALPREVLTSEMRHHQKYFALQKATDAGELSNHFIITANMRTDDGAAAIRHGNARVLRARLADGEFYWDQDRNVKLSDWAGKLRDVVFHAKVGMMDGKVERIVALAATIAPHVPGAGTALVKRAAELAKADLTTGMVGEFPELQGIMGRYYALQQNETPEVADAIRDHYKPVGASDDVPTHPVAICVALADKLDSITSLFAAGEKPTGSKDPLALRRAALGVLRIILANDLRFTLDTITQDADVISFFRDRLSVILRDEGIRHDVIASVLSGPLDATLIRARALAVQSLVTSEAGGPILAAYKRATNILSAEEKKDKTSYHFAALTPALLTEPQEQALHTALLNARQETGPLLGAERFGEALAVIARLNTPLTAFFDSILVNAEDSAIRVNRLNLLALIRETMHSIADFSVVEG